MKNIPVKLEDKLVDALDRLVDTGLYLNRSEAIRAGIRQLVLTNYLSINQYLKKIATVAAETLIAASRDLITEIKLFGSVAKGTANTESDIDLLIITKRELNSEEEQKIHEVLLPISLGADVLITPIIISEQKWQNQIKSGYSFVSAVLRSGVNLVVSDEKGESKHASA